MAGDRAERPPRPERQHPIGQAQYAFGQSWSVAYNRGLGGNAQVKANEKLALQAQLDAMKALVEAW